MFIRCIQATFHRLKTQKMAAKAILANGRMMSLSMGMSQDGTVDVHPCDLELCKRRCAYFAVQQNVKSGYRVGVGTGSTAKYVVDCLANMIADGKLKDIVCVPTSFQVDNELTCIKGGGGALAQEKIVMSCAKRFIIVADYRKRSKKLGTKFTYLPLEVLPAAYTPVKKRIERMEGGEVNLRMAVKKAGPIITDNGNYVLDFNFPKNKHYDWFQLHKRLIEIPGIVETGLFVGVAERAYFGNPDGSVEEVVALFGKCTRHEKEPSPGVTPSCEDCLTLAGRTVLNVGIQCDPEMDELVESESTDSYK